MYLCVWLQVDGVALDEIVIGDADQARRNALPGQGALGVYVPSHVEVRILILSSLSFSVFLFQGRTECSGEPVTVAG